MLPGAAAVAAARWSSAAAPRRSSWRTPPDAGPHLKPGNRKVTSIRFTQFKMGWALLQVQICGNTRFISRVVRLTGCKRSRLLLALTSKEVARGCFQALEGQWLQVLYWSTEK